MSPFGDAPIPQIVSGHAADGSPATLQHAAILPLPCLCGPHADGTLRGLAPVPARSASPDCWSTLNEAVVALEQSAGQLSENHGLLTGGAPWIPLRLGPNGVHWLRRIAMEPAYGHLSPADWCGPSKQWFTATPIALDRNPGLLNNQDATRRAKAIESAIDCIVAACERVGLPAPQQVSIDSAPYFAGSGRVQVFPRFEAGNVQRVLTHARLYFHEPIAGPIALGARRYTGLALCKPIGSSD